MLKENKNKKKTSIKYIYISLPQFILSLSLIQNPFTSIHIDCLRLCITQFTAIPSFTESYHL